MQPKKNRLSAGFTLLETLTTIFVFTLIMIAGSEITRTMFREPSQRFAALDSVDQVRAVSMSFANELRNAQTGSDGAYALGQASTSQIVFFSSYGSGSTTTIQRLRYFVATSSLYKGIVRASGNPPSYNLASEEVRQMVRTVENGSASAFFYYDGSFAGTSTPLSQPVNLNQVKFIQMRLIVQTQDRRTGTSTYSVTSGASIRSLKTNLGN